MDSLRHLGDHIRSFGALFVYSAMAFESAHSFLGKMASHSHDFNQLICRRYLELRYLLNAELESDSIVFLYTEMVSKKTEMDREVI